MPPSRCCLRLFVALAIAGLTGCPDKDSKVVEPPDAGPAQLTEQDPNERPDQAQALAGSSVVSASLSADPSRPDEDWFVLDVQGPTVVDVALTGIPGGDIALEVYDQDRNRLAAINSEGIGKPERLPNLGVTRRTWLRVYSAKRGAGGAYTLTALFSPHPPGFELEPNDRAVDANALPLGQSVSGFLGHAADEDWYRIELSPGDEPQGELPAPAPPPPPSEQPQEVPDAGAGTDPAAIPPEAGGGADGPGAVGTADAGTPPLADGPSLALRIELSAVEGVRFDVQVLSAAEAPLFRISGREGEGLSLRNIGVRQQDRIVYLVVKSAWSGTGKDARRSYNVGKAYSLTVAQEEAGANAELEPNDEPFKATPLPANGFREGFLSPKGDVDYYVLRSPEPVRVKAHLSGVERLDLVLSVVQQSADGAEVVVLKANDGAVKEPEMLNNVACHPQCLFKVEGALRRVDGKWVKDFENSELPYRLNITSVPDDGSEELEPNTAESPTPITLGRPIRGTIFPRKDTDFYRLDLSAQPVRVPLHAHLTGILKVDVALYLHRVDAAGKTTLVQTSDRGKGEAPESIRYSAEPGVYLLEVRDSKNRESNFQDAYQLTVQLSDE